MRGVLYSEIVRVLVSLGLRGVMFGALAGAFCMSANAESARHDEAMKLAAMVDSALENSADSAESSPATKSAAPQEERVDIINYKRNKIVGYMVLKNGNIIKQVIHKYPKDFQTTSQTPNQAPAQTSAESKAESSPAKSNPAKSNSANSAGAQTTPAQNPSALNQSASAPAKSANQAQNTQESYERQISSAPADNKKAAKTKESTKEAAKDSKKSVFDKTAKKSSKNMIQSEAIPQESGNEARATNQTYKNRQWDKKKIIHEVQTQVIDIGDAKK
ncbi:hypothetical protein BKN38_08795 [Helicobacter sp. CLO-3]|uniref:hypothetical protein n=1 Tax=unclassified Helicobacter TaxID=2593540 RepID=UPI000804C254|nr:MULTISPECIES: hypothetical protein [unclassified Helicobacter]OBV28942.1 hypothetical protein BA723_07390 [Helicobacter sp. CLO-3]OHU81558.1 hypothetical protein BKN38_08795 [Helicobacter sp. CLO-3]